MAILVALWLPTVSQGWILLERYMARRFLSLRRDPKRTLATFNVVSIVLAISPWAALSLWVYWILEGEWLDALKPAACEIDAAMDAHTLKRT